MREIKKLQEYEHLVNFQLFIKPGLSQAKLYPDKRACFKIDVNFSLNHLLSLSPYPTPLPNITNICLGHSRESILTLNL